MFYFNESSEFSSANSSNARKITLITIVAYAFHIVLIVYYFSNALRNGFSEPLTNGDLSFHFASAMEGVKITKHSDKALGYSPSFMAGYPFGIWNSMSHRGYEMAACYFPVSQPEVGYGIFIFSITLLTPLLLPIAARILGIRGVTWWVTALISVVLFQLDNQISYFWLFGNIGFPAAAALSVLCTALCLRHNRRFLGPVVGGALLGIGFWLHPLIVVPAGAGCVAIVLFGRGRRRQLIASCLIYGTVALAIAGPWLFTLWINRDLRSPMAIEPLQASIKSAVMDVFSDRGYLTPFDRRATIQILLVLASVGTILDVRKRGALQITLFGAGLALFLATYSFSYFPTLRQLQPYRFMIAYEWFWVVPAALGFEHISHSVRNLNPHGRLVAGCLALMLLPNLTAYAFDLAARRPCRGLDANQLDCLAQLRSAKQYRGRVLCDDLELGNLVPYMTQRETIGGGLSSQAVIPMGWTCVDSQRAFGKSVRDLTSDNLAKYLSLYRVTFAIARGESLKKLLRRLDGTCHFIASYGPYDLFEVHPKPMDGVWEGVYDDRITAGPNQIKILNAPAGIFTINYHYSRNLKATSGSELHPMVLADDPVPFIQINNRAGNTDVVIEFVY